jgi:hypothetical protein
MLREPGQDGCVVTSELQRSQARVIKQMLYPCHERSQHQIVTG